MKHLFYILISSALLSACPALPNSVAVYFNKKGMQIDAKKLSQLAEKEHLQSDFIKDNNITIVFFKKGNFAYSKDGKAIVIEAKKVKSLLQKAYKQKILHIDKKDLNEIIQNIAPARDIFFLPKKCSLKKEEKWQITYTKESKSQNKLSGKNEIKGGHWYGVENNNKISFKNGCPVIKLYR